MTFIEMGQELEDAKEAELAPEGEYDVVVKSVEHVTQNGKNHIKLMLVIENAEENYAPFNHYIALPKSDDDAQKRQTKALMAKRFLVAFDIPTENGGFNPMDIEGANCRIGVTQSTNEYEGQTYVRNELKVPRLPGNS